MSSLSGREIRVTNGSTKVKFSVTWSTKIYKIGSGKLKLALVCVRELQKLAIVAMKSLSIWLGSIKRTITRAWLPITPRSYANRGRDRSCDNTVCRDAMDSYPCSPSLDSRPFQVHTEIARCWVRQLMLYGQNRTHWLIVWQYSVLPAYLFVISCDLFSFRVPFRIPAFRLSQSPGAYCTCVTLIMCTSASPSVCSWQYKFPSQMSALCARHGCLTC